MEYVTALKNSLETSINESFGTNLSRYEKAKITNCLSGLASVNVRLKSVSEFGFSQLRSSAVKPRVKPWLDTFFHSVSLHLTDQIELNCYRDCDCVLSFTFLFLQPSREDHTNYRRMILWMKARQYNL